MTLTNKYLKVLWHYPTFMPAGKKIVEDFLENSKEDSANGDAYAGYVAFIIDIVCFRREGVATIAEMDELITSYGYPKEFSQRLSEELFQAFITN